MYLRFPFFLIATNIGGKTKNFKEEVKIETSRICQNDDACCMSCARTPSDIKPLSSESRRKASSFCLYMKTQQ